MHDVAGMTVSRYLNESVEVTAVATARTDRGGDSSESTAVTSCRGDNSPSTLHGARSSAWAHGTGSIHEQVVGSGRFRSDMVVSADRATLPSRAGSRPVNRNVIVVLVRNSGRDATTIGWHVCGVDS